MRKKSFINSEEERAKNPYKSLRQVMESQKIGIGNEKIQLPFSSLIDFKLVLNGMKTVEYMIFCAILRRVKNIKIEMSKNFTQKKIYNTKSTFLKYFEVTYLEW